MLKVPLFVANGSNNAVPADMSSVLGANVALEDYVIAGLITPADLEATSGALTFGLDGDSLLPYKDGAGNAVTISFSDGEFVRLKASDYPFLPPFVGISLGSNVSVEAGRTLYLLLAKR